MIRQEINTKGIGGHQAATARTHEWLTPPEIIKSLGDFDLDPCSPINRPWSTAKKHYTIEDNGLLLPWDGRVWCNPPYGKALAAWLNKMALHNNGISLTFARTDTNAFHDYVFSTASSILWIKQRLTFYKVDGTPGNYNGGAPSILIAYGEQNSEALSRSGIKGAHLPVRSVPVIVVGISPTWRGVASIALTRLNGKAELRAIYDMVEMIAPDKVRNNPHYKEKIRQQMGAYFTRIRNGYYSN